MAQHNKPSHEASIKGGQHSRQGMNQGMSASESTSGMSQSAPSHDASVKGGQNSHKSGRSNPQASVKGGQHSHSGSSR